MDKKIERIRNKMKEEKGTAIVMLSVENVTYFIDTMIPSHETNKTRRVILIVHEKKEPILIIVGMARLDPVKQ